MASVDYLTGCLTGAPMTVTQAPAAPQPAPVTAEPVATPGTPAPAAEPIATEPAATPETTVPAPTAGSAAAEAMLQPLNLDACAQLAQDMAQMLGVGVTVGEAPFTDPATGATGTDCQVTATGTGEQFRNPQVVVSRLGSMLERQGWKNDPMLVADGPTGTASGFRKEDQICVAGARWQPDASANCPADQPISTCQVTPAQQLYTVTLDCAQSATTAAGGGTVGMANPASVNCAQQGGTLAIEDARRWRPVRRVLLRGQPPVRGMGLDARRVPRRRRQGHRLCDAGRAATAPSPAETYTLTGNSGADDEQGTCTFQDGGQCDAWDYYNGKCLPTSAGS